MPPRSSSSQSGGGPARGRGGGGRGGGRGGHGGGGARAGPPQLVGRGGAQMAGAGGQPSGLPAAHVKTVGVRRFAFGTAGKRINVFTNACEATVPQNIIYHYDVAIASEKTLPPRFTMLLIKQLQLQPEFHPAGAYDGKKNLFMPHIIDFGGANSHDYNIALNGNSQPRDRPPRVYKIRITKAAELNPEVLQLFVEGKQGLSDGVETTLTALNIAIRMLPMQKFPFNTRSFFTESEARNVGQGFQLRRGFFQSLRPAIGRLLFNIDLSTGLFYRDGPLIDVALEVVGNRDPASLSFTRGLPERMFRELERYVKGVRVSVQPAARGAPPTIVTINTLTREGAQNITFKMSDGNSTNVASYFQRLSGRALHYPGIICAKTSRGAVLPMERCTIIPGQLARKQIPPDVTRAMVEFSTKRPADRLASIRNGFAALAHGQSEYVRNFGLNINEQTFPMSIEARQLPAPKLEYGKGSKDTSVIPRDGAWNMTEKKLFKPETISRWVMVVFETQNRFRKDTETSVVRSFIEGCQSVGMNVEEKNPIVKYASGQGGYPRIKDELRQAGLECVQKHKVNKGPDMLLIILPDGGNDIYRAVKHFGDIAQGVVTQCLLAKKCTRANLQYWANVCLKLNSKLGGVNVVPAAGVSAQLSDPQNPTIIMGADVTHPAPGLDTPSYSALVGSVDSRGVKYIPRTSVQASRQEIIADLETMSKEILKSYMEYQIRIEEKPAQASKPKRLLFFRDGVSEGYFGEVMEQEVKILKKVCQELKIAPRITFIVVGKRHHYRFFPEHPEARGEADRSGNCIAGTVVDRGITHPLEYDFYLQSHGGLLGTSRSAHYSVLYDDNNFIPDALQALCYTLCHIYARSTRSVSIPAPVYYADIVCARAKIHYDPSDTSDLGTVTSHSNFQSYVEGFRPLHNLHKTKMYFM
ncbi:argonaute-like protein [Lentinula raphanica]|uniref:Argonaute-like protein n=1 Tax=Lentinula raphanica TaxID=153919 RepID=A0AA38PKH2_9AGAR|nr:argonaute-like protein [Lentinula raphanica]